MGAAGYALVQGKEGRLVPVEAVLVDKTEASQAGGRKTFFTIAIPQAAAPDLQLPEGRTDEVTVAADIEMDGADPRMI